MYEAHICLLSHESQTQQTWDVGPTLVYCLATVVDGGPTVNQRWANVSCFLCKAYIFVIGIRLVILTYHTVISLTAGNIFSILVHWETIMQIALISALLSEYTDI